MKIIDDKMDESRSRRLPLQVAVNLQRFKNALAERVRIREEQMKEEAEKQKGNGPKDGNNDVK